MIRPVEPPDAPLSPPARLARAVWSPSDALERLSDQPNEKLKLAAVGREDSTLAHVTHCLAEALPETDARITRIQATLRRAGQYEPLAYQKLAAVRYVGMLASLVVFGTLTIIASPAAEPWCVAGLSLGMLTSWRLPLWRLQWRAARRIDAIERALPDFTDLIAVCLSQGLSVQSTLETAGRELSPIHPELADELVIVCRQAELGSVESALEDFETRIDLPEIRALVTRLMAADLDTTESTKHN
jgi:tight adherence protein C